MFIEKRIIHTMLELNRYLFVDDIDDDEMEEDITMYAVSA